MSDLTSAASVDTNLTKSEKSAIRNRGISKMGTYHDISRKEEINTSDRKAKANSIESQVFLKKKRLEDANGGKVNLPMFVIKMVHYIDTHGEFTGCIN